MPGGEEKVFRVGESTGSAIGGVTLRGVCREAHRSSTAQRKTSRVVDARA